MGKKQYEKPKVSRVELKPEEAALTACKTGNLAGVSGGGGRCTGKSIPHSVCVRGQAS
jgi:hypothetical protein